MLLLFKPAVVKGGDFTSLQSFPIHVLTKGAYAPFDPPIKTSWE